MRAKTDRSDETTSIGIPWSQYSIARKKFKQRWPSIWHLDIITNPFNEISKLSKTPVEILDVGATEKVWKLRIETKWPEIQYYSLDVDRTTEHDFYDFSEVNTNFDLVICFEVLEHLKPLDCVEMIKKCTAVCKNGQYVVFSVPNLLADTYWLDFTHQTALSFWDLPTLMNLCDLELVTGARWYNGSAKKLLLNRYLLYLLFKSINKDFCHSILMIGRKNLH